MIKTLIEKKEKLLSYQKALGVDVNDVEYKVAAYRDQLMLEAQEKYEAEKKAVDIKLSLLDELIKEAEDKKEDPVVIDGEEITLKEEVI